MIFALQCINYAIASFIRVILHPHLHTLYLWSRYSFPGVFLIDIPQEVTITQRPIYDSTTRGYAAEIEHFPAPACLSFPWWK